MGTVSSVSPMRVVLSRPPTAMLSLVCTSSRDVCPYLHVCVRAGIGV